MLFVSRACFNEFLLLLDVAWVNKVLLLLLLLLYCDKFHCFGKDRFGSDSLLEKKKASYH